MPHGCLFAVAKTSGTEGCYAANRMEIFLHIDNQKVGPLTIHEVREKLRSEQITPDTKAWVKGMKQWQPLRELAPLQESVEIRIADAGDEEIAISEAERSILSEQTSAQSTEKPRPWLRFWARFADTPLLMASGILFMNYVIGPEILEAMILNTVPRPDWIYVVLFFAGMAASWVLTETLLLTLIGTTPGKWCLNIRIVKGNGERLSFTDALRRSLVVFVLGMGFNYIFSQIICHVHAYLTLTNQGKTYWDKKQNLTVTHHPVSPMGIIRCILFLFASCLALYHLLGDPQWLSLEQDLPTLTP